MLDEDDEEKPLKEVRETPCRGGEELGEWSGDGGGAHATDGGGRVKDISEASDVCLA